MLIMKGKKCSGNTECVCSMVYTTMYIQTKCTEWTEDSSSWKDLSGQLLPLLLKAEFLYALTLHNIRLKAWHIMWHFVINKTQK